MDATRIGDAIDLRLGDCLEVLRTPPDGSVGHVVTDPPYGQTNEAYDSPIAFDPAVWAECHRVAGPNAALVSFAGSPTYHRIASAIEAGGWKVRQMWAWVYKDGFITSAWPKEGFDRLAPALSPIVFATKGKALLELEREGEPWDLRARPSSKSTFSDRHRPTRITEASGHWPKSLVATEGIDGLQYFVLANRLGTKGGGAGHPNQKPPALMRRIVAKLPGTGPILDPFAGSATTLVAAAAEGFDAIGIERDPAYHAIAARRVASAAADAPAA